MLITKLEKTNCEGYIVIPNFMRDETFLVHIKVEILFMDFEIEYFGYYLRQGFKSHRYFDYEGFNNFLKITFGFSETIKTFEKYISDDLFWITRASFTYSPNNLCMRIMNVEGEYIFQTDYDFSNNEKRIINQFNLLRVFSYSDEKMNQLVSRVEYLTYINECGEKFTYPSINMFVDHSIKTIEIHLIPQGKNEILYKMKLVRQEKVFFSVSVTGYYYKLFDFKVEDESVEIAWQKRRKSLLLFDNIKTKQHCVVDQKEIENDIITYSGTSYIVNGRLKLWNEYKTVRRYKNTDEEENLMCPEQGFCTMC